jgi:hypothetical protein
MDHDLALIDRLERLYPAVVADCLDRLGARSVTESGRRTSRILRQSRPWCEEGVTAPMWVGACSACLCGQKG